MQTILVIEDNVDDFEIVKHFIDSTQRFKVEGAATLSAAIPLLDSRQIDAVLLDLSLPDVTGLDGLLELDARFPDAPIVVLTGLDDQDMALKALQHGAQDYLFKGKIDDQLLTRSIRHAIERKQIAAALRGSEQRYRSLVAALTSVVWRTDAVGNVIDSHSSWQEFTGQTPIDQSGNGWLEMIQETDRERVKDVWVRAVDDSVSADFEASFWHNETSRHRCCVARIVPIAGAGDDVVEWVGTFTDIDDARRAEQALRHTERLASLGTMAAGIAHEINNPILAAWSSAEAAMNANNDPASDLPLEQCLQNVINSAKRCADIVQNVLVFARPSNMEKTRCDITEILKACMITAKGYLIERGAIVEYREPSTRIDITANAVHLEQVFSNVLRNAAESGDRVNVQITAVVDSDHLCVSIQDDGCGMSPELRQHAFDPFFTQGKEHGTGLGLSVAHGIVLANGGSIDLESNPGKGTKVTVRLPITSSV